MPIMSLRKDYPQPSYGLLSPQTLHVTDGGAVFFGADQAWYRNWFRRLAGCGPTTASHLIWYLAATRPSACGALFPGDARMRSGMLRLMNQVWECVTPGMQGVNSPSILAQGILRFGEDRGVPLWADILEVPQEIRERPDEEAMLAFLTAAFQADLPVAFLNLSNGDVAHLEAWHWVTLVSVEDALCAEMYDQGHRRALELALWLRTSKLGGAFVVCGPEAESNHLQTMRPGDPGADESSKQGAS